MPDYKKDAQGNLIDDKGELLTDKDGSKLKFDDSGKIINEKGQFVDTDGNIIQKKTEGLKIEGLPEDYDSLPKEKQLEALQKLANIAKSAADKEKYIKERDASIGELRKSNEALTKFKEEAEPILEAIKAKGGKAAKDPELEELLVEAKEKGYAEEDIGFFQRLVDFGNKKATKASQRMIAEFISDSVREAILRDPEVDQKIFNENEEAVNKEYERFRSPKTVTEARENLKEASLKVQSRIIKGMTKEAREAFEAERDERIGKIAATEEKGKQKKDTRSEEEKIRDDIIGAGGKSSGGVFG